jgi:hypothetical protein
VEARLRREEVEESELVQPVEVVGDDHVVARTRDVGPALDLEAEAKAQQRDADEADEPVREVRAGANGNEVGGRQSFRGGGSHG